MRCDQWSINADSARHAADDMIDDVIDDIVRKLGEQLSTPIDTECKVVYVLCETRKLLEKCLPDPRHFTLKLYCHWALHVDLERDSTTNAYSGEADHDSDLMPIGIPA